MKHNIFKIRKLGQPIQTKQLSQMGSPLKTPTQLDSLKASVENTNNKMMELMTMFQSFMKATLQQASTHIPPTHNSGIGTIQREVRDRHIELPLPSSESVTKQQTEKWITDVCVAAFSTSFHYYLTEQMTFQQTKVFCSENVLRNLLLFTSKYKLTDKQIQNINKHIGDKVLQYLAKKYPLTQSNDVNKALQRQVQETNHLDLLTNDFLYTHGIIFKYRSNGNYNDMIMRVINKLIQVAEQTSQMSTLNEEGNKKREQQSNYNDFQNFMSGLFDNVYDEDWMVGSRAKADRADSDATYIAKKVNAEAHKFKYEEKVRSYTNYLIGRKISQNTVPYTQAEIKGKNLIIKSPAILRILTKWCQQLWQKFESQTYFTSRTESIQLQNPQYINPFFKWMKTAIDTLAAAEKKQILAFKAELDSNSYHQQSQYLLKHLEEDNITSIPRYQKASGKFATQMVKNLHSYITLYLNRLIHGLLTVSKTFYQRQVDKSWDDWQSPPNLITFQIGDLLRCKMSSKEKQIIKIFNQIKRISNNNHKKMKIVRIKNRLKQGTNDILINIKFNNLIICEIQLEVINKSKTKFIQCSNSFSHYIYEMNRSIFGPISQLCNIWNNFQARASEYQSFIKSSNQQSINKISCIQDNSEHQLIKFDLPFQCSFCQKLYYHNNYIIHNKKCQKCNKYKCVKCQIIDMDENQLKKLIFNSKKFKSLSDNSIINKKKVIPNVGVCVKIQSTSINIEVFQLKKYEGKTWLLGQKDQLLYNIKRIYSPKDSAQFLNIYCTFEIVSNSNLFINITDKMAQNFAIEEYVKESYKQQKEVLILTQIRYSVPQMIKLMKVDGGFERNKKKIKRLEFASNYLDDISFFQCFQNITTINLDFNNFTNMKVVRNFKMLQKLQMRQNSKLISFDDEICELTKLQEIKISNCKISYLPQKIGNLTQLTVLKMDKNPIAKLPQSLCDCLNLKQLSFISNTIKQLPSDIGKLTNLRKLIMKKNCLKQLPISIGQLVNLEILNISQNQLSSLPENLMYLTKLETLRLENNQLQAIPQTLLSIQSLKNLCLFSNKIKSLPNNFKLCKNLQLLQLHKNFIEQLPQTLAECNNLSILTLQQNKLRIIPDFVSKLKHLSSSVIELNGNQLTQIPSFIFEMQKVTDLNLSSNNIVSIPSKISKLEDLVELNLNSNKIQQLNQEITSLKSLKKFTILENQLTKVPSFVKDLATVKNNKVWENQFQRNQISQIESSELFDLMGNKIIFTQNKLINIPLQLINNKETILAINFQENQIKQIPSDIRLFINLQTLKLSKNLIQIVPKQIEELTKLKKGELFLDNNPLKQINCLTFCLKYGSFATIKTAQWFKTKEQQTKKQQSKEIPQDPSVPNQSDED